MGGRGLLTGETGAWLASPVFHAWRGFVLASAKQEIFTILWLQGSKGSSCLLDSSFPSISM